METRKKVVYEHVDTITDTLSGEILEIKRHTQAIVEKEPDYIKMYIADVTRLKDLPKNTDKVLHLLLKSMSYKNIIPAYAPIKRMICSELNIKMDTLNKAIDNLYKEGILIRIERGIYMADPHLFGKGEWKNIKNLRLIVEYKEDGTREISGERIEELKLF
ncbi:hypothetical protein EON73_02240 [bacterium]|nr:MAG: hypothetical protein EON73_02240 [bacterium]